MDVSSELTDLASNAAGQMIKVLATDGWTAVKSAFVSLWWRLHPDRVDAELTQARNELVAAKQHGDATDLENLLVDEWRIKLTRLLLAHPEVVDDLRRLVDNELSKSGSSGQQKIGAMTVEMRVTGGGDAYLAGRDMTINRNVPDSMR
jgi:hypothetical protein